MYISMSSDSALYLEDNLMDECHTLGYWVSVTFNVKLNVGHGDLYLMIQWFCRVYHGWISCLRIMSQCGAMIDLIINVGHSDLHCMVQWFCLIMLFWSPMILPSVLLAKQDSGELCCPVTALIKSYYSPSSRLRAHIKEHWAKWCL